MKIEFHVNPAAAAYIHEYWQKPGDLKQLVVVVQAELAKPTMTMEATYSIDKIIERGQKFFGSLPLHVKLRWSVGAAREDRFPAADLHVVDGVKFYLTEETISLIGKRELVLNEGELRFEPELDPFTVER